MNEERTSATEIRLHNTLAVLPVFWGIVLLILASVLNDEILTLIGLDMNLVIGAAVPLLIVSGLMLERASATRKRESE
jgi:hypothetical protein